MVKMTAHTTIKYPPLSVVECVDGPFNGYLRSLFLCLAQMVVFSVLLVIP